MEAELPTPRSLLLPLAALTACLFFWAALLTFNPGDWPSPHQFPHNQPAVNACGQVGAFGAYWLRHVLGDGAYPLLLFFTLMALSRLTQGPIGSLWERGFGLALLVGATSTTSYLMTRGTATASLTGHGGLVGFGLGRLMTTYLDRTGTIIVVVSSLIVGLLFITEGWVLRLPGIARRTSVTAGNQAIRVIRAASATAGSVLKPAIGVTAEETEELLGAPRARASAGSGSRNKSGTAQGNLFDEEEAAEEERKSARRGRRTVEPEDEEEDEAVDEVEEDAIDEDEELDEDVDAEEEEEEEAPAQAARARAARALAGPKVNMPSPQRMARAEPYPKQIENWRLPSLDLLEAPQFNFSAQQETAVREQAKVLEGTLSEFRLDARVVEIDTGPVITMFELRLGSGVKVSQISALSNDIARALKAHAIRVVAPISGKNTIGVEVPNLQKEQVRLKELMTMAGKKASEQNLPLFLGKDASGAALVTDLTKMPHLLIAGTTGSGKSVCLNAIILSLLMTKRPDHVKLILIDPKMVEMSQFKEVPHLMCPIVTDMARAEKILEWAVTKMDERYELLAEARVRDIASYNRLGADELYRRMEPTTDEEKAQISTHLPFIVIVIDELADLMMTSAKEVEHHLSRLAQKSRAVGIHIIVATQRPEAKVLTGLIKSNLPCRICFRVASRLDSRIVLDQNGGEVLLGQGDMLLLPPGMHKLTRAQGTFLDDREVQAVLDDLASRAKPEFHPELVRIKTPGEEGDLSLRDPLFDDAVRIILESRRGSVSLLQRRLNVGYSRASRLIDQMAEAGIVGDYKGSQAREVTLTLEEWDAIRSRMEEEENEEATVSTEHEG